MANLFSIYFDANAPATAAVEVADADNLWVTHSLQVRVSLRGPGSFTPTQVKVWGIDDITTESGASWQPMSATITGTLQNISEWQFLNAKFWDGGSNYATATSSGILYEYDAPVISTAVTWKTAPIDERSTVGVLTNLAQDTELTLSKTLNPGLLFHNLDISDLNIGSSGYSTTIAAASGTAIYSLLRDDVNSYIPVKKTFVDKTKPPLIRYNGAGGFSTITKYDGTVKTGYTDKITNVAWNDTTGEFTFNIHEFSSYGFATIGQVVFTTDSQTGGYNNDSIIIKAKVYDTHNQPVEGAPVTFTIASGTSIGSFVDDTTETDVDGVAQATLNLTTVGTAYIDAEVDGVSTSLDSRVYCIARPANLQRSLLTQYEQIRSSVSYVDTVSGVNTPQVAQPENSTFDAGADDVLEHDINVMRTLLKQLKGTSDWFENIGTYTDPANTTTPKQMTLSGIKGHTLDTKTILISIEDTNASVSGSNGFAVASGDAGLLIQPTDARYADTVDRRGLPIFASTTGSFYDIGGTDEICIVDLVDRSTGTTFKNTAGKLIYGKLHNGADNGGTGEGHDVYIKFYADGSPYTFTASDPTNLTLVYPFRKLLTEMQEYEWMRTDFIGSFEGDTELMEDISNLWAFTGATNNEAIPSWSHTSVSGGGYAVVSGSSLVGALDYINSTIGDTNYTTHYYITPLEDISTSLVVLDARIKTVTDAILAGTGTKYTETITSDINAGTSHTLPYGITYTPYTAVSGLYGRNMDVFVNGQLLTASYGINGASEDMDYSEVSTSGIKFHIDVNAYSNIMYAIRQ